MSCFLNEARADYARRMEVYALDALRPREQLAL